VLFTSNWEKTLGTDPGGDSGGSARQDVFLLKLGSQTDGGSGGPRESVASGEIVLPDGRVGRLYAARLAADGRGATATWRLVSGALPPGLRLASSGKIGGAPRVAGTFRMVVRTETGSDTTTLAVSITVR
jgi:hypothetical protein